MPSPSPLQLRIVLADVDRGLDLVRKLIVDRDPDTAPEHVILRVVAWCLFHAEGLRIADGPPRKDVPDLAIVGLDGKAVAWYACRGADAEEVRRIIVHNKGVDVRVLFDEDEPLERLLNQLRGMKKRPPGMEKLAMWTIDREVATRLAARPELRQKWAVTVVADHVYIDADGLKVDSALTRIPIPEPTV
jgi:uncharacterized protein YaeQ